VTKEQHQEAIDRLKVIAEAKKAIARKSLKVVDWRVLAFGNMESRVRQRKAFLTQVLRNGDSLMTDSSKAGAKLYESK
jgi:hypothetical protein